MSEGIASEVIGALFERVKEIFGFKPCLVVTAICLGLFAFHKQAIAFFNIPAEIAKYRWAVGLAALVWGVTLVVHICSLLWEWIGNRNKKQQELHQKTERDKATKEAIEALPNESFARLALFYINGTWTMDFPHDDSIMRDLVNRGIVFRPSRELVWKRYNYHRAFKVHPDVQRSIDKEFIMNHLVNRFGEAYQEYLLS